MADICLRVASSNTARIQECHVLFGHMLCDRIEMELAGDPAALIPGRA
jgi:D-sedoheptulose 7-phosphate isomerase